MFFPSLKKYLSLEMNLLKTEQQMQKQKQKFNNELDRLKNRLQESLQRNLELETEINEMKKMDDRLNVSIKKC